MSLWYSSKNSLMSLEISTSYNYSTYTHTKSLVESKSFIHEYQMYYYDICRQA